MMGISPSTSRRSRYCSATAFRRPFSSLLEKWQQDGFAAAATWRCPKCRDILVEEQGGVRCRSCAAYCQSIGGILDLRLPVECSDYESDKASALRLLKEAEGLTLEELVHHLHTSCKRWTKEIPRLRTRRVLSHTSRLRKEIRGWL